MILTLYILSILSGAIGDALMHKGNKLIGHPVKLGQPIFLLALFILALIAQPEYLWWQIIFIALSYFALRFFLWDYAWNIVMRQPLAYIGNTSFYDNVLGQLNPAMVFILKLIAGASAVTFLLL